MLFSRVRLPVSFVSFVLKNNHASQNLRRMTAVLTVSVAVAIVTPASIPSAYAFVGAAGSALPQQVRQDSAQDNQIVQVYVRRGGGAVRRGGMARRTTVVGPRGGYASRTVVRGGVARRGYVAGGVARPGRWVRPANYYWRPGGAIAAGAAIGFVSAATAAAWAGAPPGPGYCWYYTDPSRTQGFWDVCQ